MPKNIKEKLALILEDMEYRPRGEATRLIEKMFFEEMGFLEAEHHFDTYDLNMIRSRAIAMYTGMALNSEALGKIKGDSDMIRHYCLLLATIELLRGKGLIAFTMSYNKK